MKKAHQYASIFPMMPEAELHELADSIARNGQRETIVIFGDLILEGRNRARACEIAGTVPKERQFDPEQDGDPLTFVLDRNLHRRQLTASQRAAAAAEAFRLFEEKAKKPDESDQNRQAAEGSTSDSEETQAESSVPAGRTRDKAGEAFGVSGRSVADAKKLQTSNPEAFEKVKSGEGSVSGALKKTDRDRAVEQLFEQHEELKSDDEFCDAIQAGRVLKTANEVKDFGIFTTPQQQQLKPLLAKGWTVKKAAAYAFEQLTSQSFIKDLVNKAISNGDQYSVVISGFEISAQKVQSPKAEEASKPAKKAAKKTAKKAAKKAAKT